MALPPDEGIASPRTACPQANRIRIEWGYYFEIGATLTVPVLLVTLVAIRISIITPRVYLAAARAETGGYFAVWVRLRLGKSPIWLAPGILSLVLFAWPSTHEDSEPSSYYDRIVAGVTNERSFAADRKAEVRISRGRHIPVFATNCPRMAGRI